MPAGSIALLHQWLHQLVWIDLQVAIWSALLLVVGVVVSLGLRRRLPVWRKGLWLGAMLLPVAWVCLAALSGQAYDGWVPSDWFAARVNSAMGGESAASAGVLAVLFYAGWVVINLLIELGAALRLRRLLGNATPAVDAHLVRAYTQLAKSMGCPTAPRLVQSHLVASPFIVASPFSGLTIVLPELLTEDLLAMRAVLAHELAHARAGDPWVLRGLSLLRCLLPLAWLCALVAMRMFWEDAAEQTGDIRALHGSGMDQAQYATVLKSMALGESDPVAGTMGFSPMLAELAPENRRLAIALIGRLRALRLAPRWSETLAGAVGSCTRGLVCGGLLVLLATNPHLRSLVQDPRQKQTPADHSQPETLPKPPAAAPGEFKSLPGAQAAFSRPHQRAADRRDKDAKKTDAKVVRKDDRKKAQ